MRFVDKLIQMGFKGLENFGPQVGAEFSRLNTQATMELASALFNGSAFVPYGPGQYTPTPEMAGPDKGEPAVEPNHAQEHEREI
jgi:hypothetical protein